MAMLPTAVVLGLLQLSAALLSPPCMSRLPRSRIVARAMVAMCDAEGAPVETAEAAEAAAEPAEPVAVTEPVVSAEPVADAGAADQPAAEEPVAASEPRRSRGRSSKKPLSDLEVGVELEGTVRSVMAYGAFVDIGYVTDGLLHVSEICQEFVKDANDKLKAGDVVTVRVKSVNLEKKHLALTSKDDSKEPARQARKDSGRKAKPDLSEYETADEKEFISGTVNSITDYGAFVTLKDGVDGLLHISAIQEGGVKSVADVLKVGQEVQVRVVSFEKAKRRIGLSMKPYVEGSQQDKPRKRSRRDSDGFDDDDEPPMSEEELEKLAVGLDEPPISSFETAFEFAAMRQEAKQQKQKYDTIKF